MATKPIERADELGAEKAKIAFDAFASSDHHMVCAWETLLGYNLTGQRAETTLHAISYHGAADFLCNGEANTHERVTILAVADEQDEPRRGRAQAAVRGNEIRALFDCD